jgi:predicted Zn-dependent protease with MMP-like domain
MLRTHVAPVGVRVTAVEGKIGASILTSKTALFPVGDPIIGQAVSLGPNTFLSANSPAPAGPQPFEQFPPGFEPMENFELHIGNQFSGKPATLGDRPKANGFFQLTPTELTKYKVIPLNQFSSQRKTQLLDDYHALSPADRTGMPTGRNLATRIAHLGGSPPDNIAAQKTTLPPGWSGKEVYNGNINNSIQITPGNSIVMTYFKLSQAFRFSGTLLNFHSDEQCGQVDGTLQPLTPTLNRQMA